MSKLNIRLNQAVPTGINARAVTQVFDTNLYSVVSRTIDANSPNLVPIEPGKYLVQTTLPSGKVLQRNVDVPEGDRILDVVFDGPVAPSEALSWQHYLGDLASAPLPLPPEALDNVWVRVWSFGEGKWKNEGWPGGKFRTTDVAIVARLDVPTNRVCFLQIGGDHVAWRFVGLPPSPEEVEIAIGSTTRDRALTGGLTVRVTTGDGMLDALMSYETAGAANSASILWHDFSNLAIDYADKKIADGNGAAVAFYYLAGAQRLGDYFDWTTNFARSYPWLPDARVIHAMGLLLRGDRGRAKEELYEAANSGVPVYARGLRFLYGQLTAWRDDPKEPTTPLVDVAVNTISRIASSADWEERRTTFYGATPGSALPELIHGTPPTSDFVLIREPRPRYKQQPRISMSSISHSEAELMGKARARSEDAFDQLYQMYHREIRGYVRARCPAGDANDLFQETWAQLWRRISDYDPTRGNFAAFAKYWAGIILMRYYHERRRERPQLTQLFSELDQQHENFGRDELAEQIVARAGGSLGAEVQASLELSEAYRNLLAQTFSSGAPPHQLVAFGFCKLLDYTPKRFVASASNTRLDDLVPIFEREYRAEAPALSSQIGMALEPLHRALRRPLSEIITEPATRLAHTALLDRITGQTSPRDYYQDRDNPEPDVSHWIYAVRRKVAKSAADKS
jgi:RNA polymerase sigma factor (sigma-70 family)